METKELHRGRLNPDGNDIEALHPGAAERSAASVVVRFDA